MNIIGDDLLDALAQEARRAPRLRKNHNLHQHDTSACHRLFIAIEPTSYVRPHRHQDTEKDETLLIMRGSLGIVTFDDTGAVTGSVVLRPDGPLGVDIPHGVYHTAISLESGTVFFEAKAGPFLPLSADEKAAFAPEEGAPDAASFLERLAELFG